jgi:K+/H+ antiporter YhaU regulatory subunit KhtT
MANKRPASSEQSEVPHSFAEVPPRELYETSDIRFVMRETATLTERIEGLTRTIDKLAPAFEKALEKHAADVKERLGDLKADHKITADKVVEIEKKVAFVKGAMWLLGGLFALAVVVAGLVAKFG